MSFATTTDLAEYLDVTVNSLPSDSGRQLARASELVEYAVFNNYDGAKANHVEAVRKATCAQVEFWMNIGESIAIIGKGLKGYKSGDLSMDFGGSNSESSMNKLSSRATIHLGREGLLYRGVKKTCDCRIQYF